MPADIVPVLMEDIKRSFQANVLKDRRALRVSKRIRDGTANFADAHIYAQSLGEGLSRALVDTLTEESLPNGTLYYNIAQRTVIPSLEENFDLINETATEIQLIQDTVQNIGLKPVIPEFPIIRINGLIDKMTADDITPEKARRWLQEPIINTSESFADDFVRENARFRNNAGLKTTITRSVNSKCCDWCDAMAGTFDYDKAPPDIYRRHQFCRCTVTYRSEKGSQDVWSKRRWQTTPEELEQRRSAGDVRTMTAQERISQAERLARDQAISTFEQETGYSRRTAARYTRNKDPDEVQREIERIRERRQRIGR